MGTTVEKLTKVLETKEAIRTAINNKGGTLTESDTFSSYSTAIDNIQTGSEENPLQEYVNNNGGDGVPDCSYLFYYYTGKSLDNVLNGLDTSSVTNMSYMFYHCKKLISIPLLNTSSVTNMTRMFASCNKLTTIPLIDTSNVTNMSEMFCGDYNSNYRESNGLTYLPKLNTSNVTNMSRMFMLCSDLTSIPQLDTSKVTDMHSMFEDCYDLTSIPQLDTSNVTNMSNMFDGCSNLTSITLLDTSKVTNMWYMFYNCRALTYLKLLNVKVNLQIGSGSSWGHLIEKNCLIQIISELVKPSSGTKTLTMGTTNKAKLADTYVKLLDDDGTGKYPFEICESTNEGAMTIEAYCNSKNWTLA